MPLYFDFREYLTLAVVTIAILLLMVVLVYLLTRPTHGFRIVYTYEGPTRRLGPIEFSGNTQGLVEFSSLYLALGFVKSLVDRGFSSIYLTDTSKHHSWAHMVLVKDENHDPELQYEVFMGYEFPLDKSRLVSLLATTSHSILGDLD